MPLEKKLALLEEVMDLGEGELSLETPLADLEEWDSLSKLSLIAEAKRLFGLTIPSEKIKEFQTVRDICDYLK